MTNSTHTSGQVGLAAVQSGGSAFRPFGATFDDIQFFPELSLLADVNLDGIVNGLDVDPFVDVLLDGPYQAEADLNGDGDVNGLDVDLFVDAVVGGGVQSAIPEPTTLLLAITATLLLGARGWGMGFVPKYDFRSGSDREIEIARPK